MVRNVRKHGVMIDAAGTVTNSEMHHTVVKTTAEEKNQDKKMVRNMKAKVAVDASGMVKVHETVAEKHQSTVAEKHQSKKKMVRNAKKKVAVAAAGKVKKQDNDPSEVDGAEDDGAGDIDTSPQEDDAGTGEEEDDNE